MFAGFSSSLAIAQQQTEATTTTTTTTDQSATITGESTSPLTFTLRTGDEEAEAGEPEGGTATSSNLSTRTIGIEVNLIRGNEAPISLPINVTIPANVNNLDLCASTTELGTPAAEMCQPVLRTIDLTQNTAAATTDTTASGTTSPFSSPSSPSSSSSSAPTMTSPTTSFPSTATGGSNSIIGGGIEEDTTAIMVPITVIAPITADIQNARLCAQLPSGTQTCNEIILNPQQTAYTLVNVDMTTSPAAPTVISSSSSAAQGTGTTGTGGGGTTSSSSSTTTTITTPPGTTSTPSTTTTTPSTRTNNNNTNTTTGGTTSSLPAPGGRDTTSPTLTIPNDMTLQTNGPTALLEYSVRAQDDRDGIATLDEDNQLTQGDNVGGNIFISCRPSSQYFLPLGNRTVECNAFDAANNTGTASFVVSVTRPTIGGISASLTANPATSNGPCPVGVTFSGTITDNVGNRDVRFRINQHIIYDYEPYQGVEDETTGSEQVIHFDQPGSKSVDNSGLNSGASHGWAVIEILQPVQLQSNRAEFQITCTAPNTGAAQTLQAENTTTATTATDEEDTTTEAPTTDGEEGGEGGAAGDTGGDGGADGTGDGGGSEQPGTDEGGGESPSPETGGGEQEGEPSPSDDTEGEG
ncbi:MAG: hypothetical protein M3298_09280 [Thermoproteota archaeon]|nr:hypothetical protein [Thermoproteota archaeon]